MELKEISSELAKYDVYFGENGLTSTSANHVANLAKENTQQWDTTLSSLSFIYTTLSVIGSPESHVVNKGTKDEFVGIIPTIAEEIGDCNALISWLREAIKAQESVVNYIKALGFEELCGMLNIEIPQKPKKLVPKNEDDVEAEMSIKERNRMLTLNAKSAAIGKLVHPDGYLSKARKEYYEKRNNPTKVIGDGRDTLIYSYDVNVDSKTVDDLFFGLQAQHRQLQSELNGYRYKIRKAVEESEAQTNETNMERQKAYVREIEQIEHQVSAYRMELLKQAGNLKIVIPNDLKSIFERINSLGK